MSATLKKALKSLIAQSEAILASAGDKPLTAEQAAHYNEILAQATATKSQIEQAEQMDALKAWGNQPDGQSAVRTGFTGNSLPGEGDIYGVTGDQSGEMYAQNGEGEARLGALKSGAYKDAFAKYIRAAGLGKRLDQSAAKVLNEGSDTTGGFWVPPDYRQELIKKIATLASVRPNAYAFTTGSDLATFPKVVYTTDNLYTAGTRISWQESSPLSADMSESTNPVAGRITIPVHTATAAIIITREQLEDNQFDLLGYISGILAEAFALGEEDAFTNGNGIGQPQGILSHANATTASTGGGMYIPSGTSGSVAWGVTTSQTSAAATKGLVGMEAALPPQYEANAKWMATKATYSAIRGMSDTAGRPLWNPTESWPTMTNGYAPSLLGYPVVKNQFAPAIGVDTYPVLFGDFSGYFIADRVGLSIEVLRELRALRGEVVIYARKRVGGQLVKDWQIKTQKLAAS